MVLQPGYGLLITAAVSACVGLISLTLGVKVVRHKAVGRSRVPAISFANIWFMFAGVYFSVAIRTAAAYFEAYKVDELFFYIDNFFGVMLVPTTMFFVFYFYLKNKKIANFIAAFFFVVAVVWWIFDVRAGAHREFVDFWLSEWKMASQGVENFAKYALYVPCVLAILSLNIMARRAKSRAARYKVFLSSLSITGATLFMMLDLLGTTALMGFIGRVCIMLFCVLGYLSYFPTRRIEAWIRQGD